MRNKEVGRNDQPQVLNLSNNYRDALPTGALPVYERDIDVAATVVSANGSAPESVVRGDRVTIPEFEIVSNPLVRIREVRQRRFNVIERAVQKAKQEIN